MTAHEKSRMVDGVLVEVPSWHIGQLLTQHDALSEHPCAIVLELRRNGRQKLSAEKRLELARATACTCGRGH